MRNFFTFPNPVNETSARVVATGAVVLATTTIATQQYWLLIPLAYGFIARTAAGPKISPLGLFATKVATPLISTEHKYVPGPPKRFAQAIGATLTIAALITYYALGATTTTNALLVALIFAATLEAAFAICLGCTIFNALIKLNVIPEKICAECANITQRTQTQP